MPFILLQQDPQLLTSCVFLLGLIAGSFLNVVIYRLPLMLHRTWRRECRLYLQLPDTESGETFNLLLPASHCPACHSPIGVLQNIPVISYLLLGGKCRHCGAAISWRYPLVEMLTASCSALIAWHFGYSMALVFALLLTWSLIALSFIDIEQLLLPDEITQPMLWLGLLLSVFDVFTDSQNSIIGAMAGYIILFSVYQAFKSVTGKEGMGFGDFKLLAMLGAWLGWQYLPLIILLSSLTGAIVGIGTLIFAGEKARKPMPFGQYLALAGWLALLWGDALNDLYLRLSGLIG
ncbi:MAG: A24 family peptidase [Methylococcales bacterium]|nr:A24 family peptidase [Methylococcales bacterium]